MSCELMSCCQFFNDNMKHMPRTAEYMRERLCMGDYRSCNRYKLYKQFGGAQLPYDLDCRDSEEVQKAMQCLRKRQLSAAVAEASA